MRTHGTTLECFADLMEQIEPELLEKRKVLAQILGVDDSTIRRWSTGPSVPIGMSMVSLRCYLDFLGYRVSEFTRQSSLLQDASRLLAFRVMTLEHLAQQAGIADPSDLLKVLRGERGLSTEREAQLRGIVTAHRQELADKQRAVPKLVTMKAAPSSSEVFGGPSGSKTIPSTTAPATSRPAPKSASRRDERFKGLVLNLLDFAQFYAQPDVPEEVRDQLRLVVGQQNIFDLKNLLARLCSSKAFSNQQ